MEPVLDFQRWFELGVYWTVSHHQFQVGSTTDPQHKIGIIYSKNRWPEYLSVMLHCCILVLKSAIRCTVVSFYESFAYTARMTFIDDGRREDDETNLCV